MLDKLAMMPSILLPDHSLEFIYLHCVNYTFRTHSIFLTNYSSPYAINAAIFSFLYVNRISEQFVLSQLQSAKIVRVIKSRFDRRERTILREIYRCGFKLLLVIFHARANHLHNILLSISSRSEHSTCSLFLRLEWIIKSHFYYLPCWWTTRNKQIVKFTWSKNDGDITERWVRTTSLIFFMIESFCSYE